MPREYSIVGSVFGRLTVLEKIDQTSGSHKLFRCVCSCGREAKTTSWKLRSGHTRSCGCLNAEYVKSQTPNPNAKKRDPIYTIWQAMRSRCLNPTSKDYKNYGGRGIAICPEWDTFEVFKRDVGPRPTGGRYELDRENNNGPYAPHNVRWVLTPVNSRNRRNNVTLTYQGNEYCQKDASVASGVPEHVLIRRRKRGLVSEAELFAPSLRVSLQTHVPDVVLQPRYLTAGSFNPGSEIEITPFSGVSKSGAGCISHAGGAGDRGHVGSG